MTNLHIFSIKEATLLKLIASVLLILTLFTRAHAQRFDAPPYAQTGPYAIGVADVTIAGEDRDLTTTIWYPATGENEAIAHNFVTPFRVEGRGIREGQPATENAPYPLVIFSHGSGGSRVLGLFITEHLASHGYVVMAADHPGNSASELGNDDFATNYAQRPIDVLRQIDYAADVINAPDGLLDGLIDTEQVGVIGHSFGGLTALLAGGGRLNTDQLSAHCDEQPESGVCFLLPLVEGIATARGLDAVPQGAWPQTTDPRIKAIVALAPWNGPILSVDDIAIPTLTLVGESDSVTPPQRDAFIMYEQLTPPKSLATFALADHYIFVDTCPEVLVRLRRQRVCSDLVWSLPRVHDITNHLVTAFFAQQLKGDVEAAAALTTDAVSFRGVTYEQIP